MIQEGKPNVTQDPKLLMLTPTTVDNSSLNQEVLWFLEFDGSINKLGAGVVVWIHNKQNSHA